MLSKQPGQVPTYAILAENAVILRIWLKAFLHAFMGISVTVMYNDEMRVQINLILVPSWQVP